MSTNGAPVPVNGDEPYPEGKHTRHRGDAEEIPKGAYFGSAGVFCLDRVGKLPLVKATRQSDIGKEKPGIALPVRQRAGEGGFRTVGSPVREQRFSRLPPFDFSGLRRGSLR